jgi:hypothetical protein
MPTPVVRPPKIQDYEDTYQRQARKAIKDLDSPGLRKVTVGPIALGVTTVLVPHQLGRQPVGWQIIDKNAQADVWRDPSGSITSDFIPLKASATVTVTLQLW